MNINDIIESSTRKVSCNGNVESNGHPLVYLNMGEKGEVVCPYCSRKFVLKQGVKNASAGH